MMNRLANSLLQKVRALCGQGEIFRPSIREFRVPPTIAKLTAVVVMGMSVWWFVFLLVDQPAEGLWQPYATNLRIGFWVYLVEFLIQSFKASFAPPVAPQSDACNVPPGDMAVREVAATIPRVAIQVFLRTPLLILGTALMMAWCGDAAIIRVAAAFPSVLFAVVSRQPKPRPILQNKPKERGTHLGSPSEVQLRVDELWAAEEDYQD